MLAQRSWWTTATELSENRHSLLNENVRFIPEMNKSLSLLSTPKGLELE